MTTELPGTNRDFAARRHALALPCWPDGKRLAVSLVVNVEEGAELSLGMGDEANEFVYEAVERVEGVRDLCMERHFEYGTRMGWDRIRVALKAHGVRATLNACGRALAYSPWIAREAVADGQEVSAHGWRWERHVYMDEASERAAIARTVAAIAAAAGMPPVGWHTRSATSPATRRLLVEQGGFLYDSNAYDNDAPYTVAVGGMPHVVARARHSSEDKQLRQSEYEATGARHHAKTASTGRRAEYGSNGP